MFSTNMLYCPLQENSHLVISVYKWLYSMNGYLTKTYKQKKSYISNMEDKILDIALQSSRYTIGCDLACTNPDVTSKFVIKRERDVNSLIKVTTTFDNGLRTVSYDETQIWYM